MSPVPVAVVLQNRINLVGKAPRRIWKNKDATVLLNDSQEDSGGGGEIRTLGALRHAGFQDRCIQPLCHPSEKTNYISLLCQ
jgi:hypothetical protein